MDENLRFQFNWKRGENVPCDITWCRTTVVPGKNSGSTSSKDAYVADYSNGIKMFRYGPETDSWEFLTTDESNILFGFGGFGDDLMLVGGKSADTMASTTVTNWLFTENQPGNTYPPLLIPRVNPTVNSWGDYLIVAGGIADNTSPQSVEILDSKSKQWKPAGVLPVPTILSSTVIDEYLYILGDSDKIYKVSIPSLTSAASDSTVWEFVTDAPFQHSTIFSFNRYLLTAGGESQSGSAVSDVMYLNESSKKWTKVGDLPQPCIDCCCIYVPQCDCVFLMAGKENRSSSLLLKGVYRAFKPLIKKD